MTQPFSKILSGTFLESPFMYKEILSLNIYFFLEPGNSVEKEEIHNITDWEGMI